MNSFNSKSKSILLVSLLLLVSAAGLQSAVSTASATPYSGSPPSPTNLTVYYHNLTTPVTIGSQQLLNIADTWNDTVSTYSNSGGNISSLHYLSLNFTVFPQLAGPLTVNGTVYSWMYFSQSGSAPTSGHITLSVYELTPSGTSALIGTGPLIATSVNYPGSAPTSIMVTGPSLNITVPANDSLSFNIVANGGTSQVYSAYWGNVQGTYYYSRAVIPASTYLEVSSLYAQNSTGQTVYSLSQTSSNKNLTIYANLTDPLGQYDFSSWPVDYSVANATGTSIASGQMTAVGSYSPYSFMRQFDFSLNYSSFPSGPIVITVNGTDNTMHNYLSASGVLYGRNAHGTLELFVGTPPVNVRFLVTDAAGNSVSGAQLNVMQFTSKVASNMTGNGGLTDMLLSGGNYTVDIFWQSVNVGAFPVTVSNVSSNFTLKAGIYSPVLVFEDQSGSPLSYTQVEFISPAGIRLPLMSGSANGSVALSEVAGGEYSGTVLWHGSAVFNGTISIDSNGVTNVSVSAYMQSFRVVSSSGSPVATANVVVVNSTTGIYAGFNTTDSGGLASSVIPYGVYTIQVYWKGIVVYSAADVLLDNPTAPTMVLNASIYDVTVKAVSSSGSAMSNVVITVYSQKTGSILSAVTGSNGEATFTVAAGNYTLTSSFITTYDLTPVSQQISQSVNISQPTSMTVKFTKVYPSLTSTNLFYIVVALVLIIAGAVAAFIAILRRGGRSQNQQSEEKEQPKS